MIIQHRLQSHMLSPSDLNPSFSANLAGGHITAFVIGNCTGFKKSYDFTATGRFLPKR